MAQLFAANFHNEKHISISEKKEFKVDNFRTVPYELEARVLGTNLWELLFRYLKNSKS